MISRELSLLGKGSYTNQLILLLRYVSMCQLQPVRNEDLSLESGGNFSGLHDALEMLENPDPERWDYEPKTLAIYEPLLRELKKTADESTALFYRFIFSKSLEALVAKTKNARGAAIRLNLRWGFEAYLKNPSSENFHSLARECEKTVGYFLRWRAEDSSELELLALHLRELQELEKSIAVWGMLYK